MKYFILCTLLSLLGAMAHADTKYLSCSNNVVNFERVGCDGTATLYCTGGSAYLDYQLNNCHYYKWDDGEWSYISNHVVLQPGRTYEGLLTNTRGGISGTHLIVDTRGGGHQGPPPPPPPQGPPPPPPPQQPPSQPTCSSEARVSHNQSVASLLVSCDRDIGVSVSAYGADGRLICDNQRFFATTLPATACEFRRDPSHRTVYRVKIFSSLDGSLLEERRGTINKVATYFYPPKAGLVSERYLRPAAQNKAFGRGLFWDAFIKVQVSDEDVDPEEGQALIKVDLIEVIDGSEKVIRTQMANSGEVVNFKVEHEYVVPKLFGKPHEAGDLRKGTNNLKIRVHDAYNGGLTTEISNITVVIE